MNLPLSSHARARMQQRGIPADALDSLLDFGQEVHDHRGASVIYFNHKARRRLQKACSPTGFKRLERHLDAYAVVGSDGSVITVGHRTRHIPRN